MTATVSAPSKARTVDLSSTAAWGFVIAQDTAALFGVGRTEASAWKDAKGWVEKGEDGKPDLEGLTCHPATRALVEDIKANGSPRSWGKIAGVYCTPGAGGRPRRRLIHQGET